MTSSREYPIKKCANPVCERPYFVPHDKRQTFCSPRCNDNYHNDRASLERKNIKAHQKGVHLAEQKIGIMYNTLEYKSSDIVFIEELTWHEIDLSIAKKETSLSKGKDIYWFNSYGLLQIDKKGKRFRIVYRNDI